ncbi:MAG TPA: hypothetical protein DCE44_15340 [Verrucomicrobiales bacterium]|nr:hypothetical protein [Verrucomicrobiales bacterium]
MAEPVGAVGNWRLDLPPASEQVHSVMTREALKDAVQTASHWPVVIELSSGRMLPVPHPDYVLFPPEVNVVVVTTAGGRFNVVDPAQIVSVSRQEAVTR